tara:strand:+ start:25 stop:510 length:486 start_codon:yes stop_codon:yes gene_type:complete
MAKKRTVTKTKAANSKSKTVTTKERKGTTVTKTKNKQKFGEITQKSKSKTKSMLGGDKVIKTSKSVERRKNPGQEAKKTVTRTGSRDLKKMGMGSSRAMKQTQKFGKGQYVKKSVSRSGSAKDYSGNVSDDMGGGLRYNRQGAIKKSIKGRSVTKKMSKRR